MAKSDSSFSLTLPGLAIIVLIVLLAVMFAYDYRISRIEPGLALEGVLTDVQKEAIRIALDSYTLIINWAVAVMGVTAFFLRANIEKQIPISKLDAIMSLMIFVLCVMSLYFGHVALELTADILSVDQFPLDSDQLRESGNFQYLFFMGGLVFFGFHVFQFLWRHRERTEQINSQAE